METPQTSEGHLPATLAQDSGATERLNHAVERLRGDVLLAGLNAAAGQPGHPRCQRHGAGSVCDLRSATEDATQDFAPDNIPLEPVVDVLADARDPLSTLYVVLPLFAGLPHFLIPSLKWRCFDPGRQIKVPVLPSDPQPPTQMIQLGKSLPGSAQ